MKINVAAACMCAALLAIEILVQQGAGQTSPATTPGQTPGMGMANRFGVTATPWFMDPTIRGQLSLSPAQFNQLNTTYGQLWNQFRTDASGLSKLTDQQLFQRMQDLSGTFFT